MSVPYSYNFDQIASRSVRAPLSCVDFANKGVLILLNALVHPAIINPDELGAALATQCFRQAKLAIDAKLGIDGE